MQPLRQRTRLSPCTFVATGGDYKVGYSGGVLYDCSVLVSEQNFVCVTINYRLGALGFLYTGTDGDSITGNFGMLDQQLALKWVASNAAAFGGDPANVNIFGQSAGAVSVALHNVAPSSKGLFNRTLMMSMPFSLPLRTPDTWKPLADSYIKHAGCSTGLIKNIAKEIECIRALPADKLVEAQVAAEHDILDEYKRAVELFLPWTPTLGSDLVPVSPIDAFHSGQLPDPSKPVIATTVENEAVLFVWQAFTKPMSSLEYDLLVDVIFAGSGGKVKKQFPLPDNMKTDARPWVSHIGTLALFVCPTRYAMAGMTAPAYVGHFDHVMSFGKAIWGPDYTECDDVVCHGSDLVPLFRPDPADIGGQYTPAEVALSQSMQTYAGSFFHDGLPAPPATGVDAGLTWPRFNMTQQMYMQYQTPANVQTSHTYETECGFFDSIGYHFY